MQDAGDIISPNGIIRQGSENTLGNQDQAKKQGTLWEHKQE